MEKDGGKTEERVPTTTTTTCARRRAKRSPEEIAAEAEQTYDTLAMEIGTYLETLPLASQRQQLIRQFEFHIAQGKEINAAVISTAIKEAREFCEKERQSRPSIGPLLIAIKNVLNPRPARRNEINCTASLADKAARLERDYQEKYGA